MRSLRITGSLVAAGNGVDKAPAAHSRLLVVGASPLRLVQQVGGLSSSTGLRFPPGWGNARFWQAALQGWCSPLLCLPRVPPRRGRALLWDLRAAPGPALLFLQEPKADLRQKRTTWEV